MVQVTRVDKQLWKDLYSENAHLIAFDKHKPSHMERIDFALIAGTKDVALGYVTVREFDSETIYWQYGGAFPGTRGTHMSWKGYKALSEWCKAFGYKRITTLIENQNTVMLKMAMQVGFRIIGCRTFGDPAKIYLEHLLELA